MDAPFTDTSIPACGWPGCEDTSTRWACSRHWFKLPRSIRVDLENHGTDSAQRALEWIADYESLT